MTGPRDKYDTRAMARSVDDEPDVADASTGKPLPPADRWRIRIQDECAAELIYDVALRYEGGDREPFVLTMLGVMLHAHESRQLEGERLRLDAGRFYRVGRTLMQFARDERNAIVLARAKQDTRERETTTRRIVRATTETNADRQRRAIAPEATTNSAGVSNALVVPAPPKRPGALAKRGALYGGG